MNLIVDHPTIPRTVWGMYCPTHMAGPSGHSGGKSGAQRLIYSQAILKTKILSNIHGDWVINQLIFYLISRNHRGDLSFKTSSYSPKIQFSRLNPKPLKATLMRIEQHSNIPSSTDCKLHMVLHLIVWRYGFSIGAKIKLVFGSRASWDEMTSFHRVAPSERFQGTK